MAERTQVQRLDDTPSRARTVGLVDTFVAAQRPDARNKAAEVLIALGSLKPQIERLGDQAIIQEQAAGARAELDANRMSWNEAIKQGVVPAGASPHFRRGFEKQRLENIGYDIDAKIREDYAASDLKNSDDVNAVRQFYQEKMTEYAKEAGVYQYPSYLVDETLYPMLEKSSQNLVSRHVDQHIAAVQENALIELDLGIQNIIQTAVDAGQFNTNVSSNAAVVGGVIQSKIDDMIKNGMDKKAANETAMKALLAAAEKSGDLDILKVANNVKLGTGTLAGTTAWKDAADGLQDKLIAKSRAALQFEDWKLNKAREDKVRTVMTSAISSLIGDPTADISDTLRELNSVDWKSAMQLEGYQKSLIAGQTREDPKEVAQLLALVASDPDAAQEKAMSMAQHNAISTETLRQAMNSIDYARRNGTVMKDYQVSEAERALGDFLNKSLSKDNFGNVDIDGLVDNSEYMDSFRADVAEFWASGEHTRAELRDYATKRKNEIIKDAQQKRSEASAPVIPKSPLAPGGSSQPPSPHPWMK